MGQVKNIHGPYLQNITATEATIVWEADKPSIGWVEVAPDDGSHFYATERKKFFDCTNGVKNTSLIHTVKLLGLKPGTNYRYRRKYFLTKASLSIMTEELLPAMSTASSLCNFKHLTLKRQKRPL